VIETDGENSAMLLKSKAHYILLHGGISK